MYDERQTWEAPSEPAQPEPATPEAPRPSPAVERFTSCRWRHAADERAPAHCTHRDVLPMAGTTGFNPESWCPECVFYKLRRAPRKPSYF